MGKVLSAFSNGFPGAIARSIDDVVIAMANRSEGEIAFGMPVALAPDGAGVVPFDGASHTAADFVGITVRNPSKTPETYGANTAAYASDELADVLVRGHIVVKSTAGVPAVGEPLCVVKATGAFGAGTGDTVIPLTNARFSNTQDAPGTVEVVLTQRSLV